MKKKIVSRVISTILVAGMLLSACSTAPKATEQQASVSGSSTKTFTKQAGQPMDPSVMKPWINSCLLGEITDETNANLKDDFYLNVNHDWLRDVKLRPGFATEMPLLQAMDIVKSRCLEILKDKNLKYDDPILSHDLDLVQTYYSFFLDWEERNKLGVGGFKSFVERINSIDSLDSMTEFLLSEEAREEGLNLFNISVRASLEDSSSYAVYIDSSNLSLGDSDEYKKLTENGKRMKKSVDDTVSYMFGRIGMDADKTKNVIDTSYAFETKISKNIMSLLENSDPDSLVKMINPVNVADIKNMQGKLPIAEYMEKYGYSISNSIILTEPNWLKDMAKIYTNENLDGMKAYLLTNIARSYISRTDEEAYRKHQEISRELQGITESMPDEDIAYSETRSFLANSLARIYVKKYVSPEEKKEIYDFCRQAVDVYRDMLQGIEWLSNETKQAAINKLDHITIHSLYPDKWEDDSIFQIKRKENGGSYLDAQKAIIRGYLARQMSHINQKVDKDIWTIDILETNAYYDPTNNSVNIIPGFFCDSTYRSDMSIEEKYGAIGSVIGHEISHAFDTNGSQFDEVGNVKDWWTNEDKKAFRERANKLVKYFDNVVSFDDGTRYSGQMVQTEAIADMAGVKCMLMLGEKIPNFDYDKFFRAYVALWARVYTVESAENTVLTDNHPLHYLRGNVTVQQFDEFNETYGIKEGDGMYIAPENRIAVW